MQSIADTDRRPRSANVLAGTSLDRSMVAGDGAMRHASDWPQRSLRLATLRASSIMVWNLSQWESLREQADKSQERAGCWVI